MRILLVAAFALIASCSSCSDDSAEQPVIVEDMGTDSVILTPDSGTVEATCPTTWDDDWRDVSETQKGDLDDAIATAIDEMQLNGAALGVSFHSERTAWSTAGGAADYETQEAWESCRSIRIGSVTKTFTVASIFLLIEEGLLSLDDDLETWVPDYYSGLGVQIRHLITNTSGIPSYNYVGNFDDTRPWEPTELVEWAVAVEPNLHFTPGTEWEYSNTNFVLLGLVIEAASGQTYEAFLEERLFDPLQLTETYVAQSGDDNPNVVASYDENGVSLHPDPSFGWSAGAIVSTPRDLARWGSMFFGGEVVSAASMAQILTPVNLPDDMGYGHGVFIEDDGTNAIYGHTGGIGGFLTYMYYFRESGITVVASSNQLEVNLRELSGYAWLKFIDL